MILVQNRRLPLNGSRLFLSLGLLLVLGGCASRRGTVQRDTERPRPVEVPAEEPKEEVKEVVEARKPDAITMLMPFQLDKISNNLPSNRDVERAALALDFYQGFRLALDELSEEGSYFKLNVLDSRDDVQQINRLAQSEEVNEAQLIIGPVFPSEINAFNRSTTADVLQVSPLAASVPHLAHVERLVSVTPTLDVHATFLAEQVVKSIATGDRVFFYEVKDADSEKFLSPIKAYLMSKSIAVSSIENLEDLDMNMRVAGKNIVFCGSTNSFAVIPLLSKLAELDDMGIGITLVGHPNWVKIPDLDSGHLIRLNTTISTSFYVDQQSQVVRRFDAAYRNKFKVSATEYAYKGYDTGMFFGALLSQHDGNLKEQLLKEEGHGISTGFRFRLVNGQGYVNNSVALLRFAGDSFRPFKGRM